jgi:hypothetical protein
VTISGFRTALLAFLFDLEVRRNGKV